MAASRRTKGTQVYDYDMLRTECHSRATCTDMPHALKGKRRIEPTSHRVAGLATLHHVI